MEVNMGGKFIVCLLAFACFTTGLCQPAQESKNVREEVYLHLSSVDLIVGETVYYSAYIYSMKTGKLSELSKILYVELLDDEGNSIHQTKLTLDHGRGNGEYFIPSLISTGNYRIVAYTRWMKNFNDFFSQPLTIINPYEKFEPGHSNMAKDNLQFFPEGGSLIPGAANRIVVLAGSGKRISGRIVSSSNDLITDFSTDQFGIGEISLKPERDFTYQAIVDKDDGFDFFDLPVACSQCVSLRVSEHPDRFAIYMNTGVDWGGSSGKIEIVSPQNVLFRGSVESDAPLTLLKADLPSGLFNIILSDDKGKVLSERLIFNNKLGFAMQKNGDEVFSTREAVDYSIEVPDNSHVSIAVSYLYNTGNQPDIGPMYSINSRVDKPQLSGLILRAYPEAINNYLAALKWRFQDLQPQTFRFLPEFRSDLLEGRIPEYEGEQDIPLAVNLSIPGEAYQVRVSEVDPSGNFILGFDAPEKRGEGYLSVMGGRSSDYSIVMENEFYDNYPSYTFMPIDLDSARIASILRRSINNQIENAYYLPVSVDTLKKEVRQISSFKSYRLDDYTRFPTIRDTFLEYIPEVSISKNESKNEFLLKILDFKPGPSAENFPTLLLLDGAPITQKEILDISPFLIERIDILNRKYFFGSIGINGIISFHTFDDDLAGYVPETQRITIQSIQDQKGSNRVSYAKDERIPDRRDLLLWEPSIVTGTSGNVTLDFHTSEVTGKYEIRIEGITEGGTPVSIRKYFTVE